MAQGTSLTTSLPTAISSAYLALACLLFGATLAVYRNPWVKDHTQGTAVTRDTAVTAPDSYPLIYQGILLSCVYVCFFFFFVSHLHGRWKFPGQGLNPNWSCNETYATIAATPDP